jgi:hypothetical protein
MDPILEEEVDEGSNIIIEEQQQSQQQEEQEVEEEVKKKPSLLSQWTEQSKITNTKTIQEYLLNTLKLCKQNMGSKMNSDAPKIEKDLDNFNPQDYILGLLYFSITENNLTTSKRSQYALARITQLYILTHDIDLVWYNMPIHQWKDSDYAQFLLAFIETFYNPSTQVITDCNSKDDDWEKMSVDEKRNFYWLSCLEGGLILNYIHSSNDVLKSWLNGLWESRFSLFDKNDYKKIPNANGKPISRMDFNLTWEKCKAPIFLQILNQMFLCGRSKCTKIVHESEINFQGITACMKNKQDGGRMLAGKLHINIILSEMILIFNRTKLNYITDTMETRVVDHIDKEEEESDSYYSNKLKKDNEVDLDYENELKEASREASKKGIEGSSIDINEEEAEEGEVPEKEEEVIIRKKLTAKRRMK